MKLAVFGGTFNPPHLGHVAAARAVVRALRPDELLIIPDGEPPHKTLPAGSATPRQRLEMCRLAFASVPRCRVSDVEIVREGPSYTVDTLRHLQRERAGAELILVLGTDMLMSFDRWYCPEEIARMAQLAVVARGERDRLAIEEKAAELRRRYGARIDVVTHAPVPISSTALRAGESPELMPPAVAQYAQAHGLYRLSLDGLRDGLRAWLPRARYEHTLGVERLAAELAVLHGADEYTVRAAALLHDCTKPLSLQEQLKLCEKWAIITDYPDDWAFAIHADTAAAVARHEAHMPEPVCRCIARHTVGAPDMSREEQIIFLADMCEETRTWTGAAALRTLARHDLRRAFIEGLRATCAHIRAQGGTPCPVTCEALARLEKEEHSHE